MSELLDRARALGTATLHEAGGRIGALPPHIKPVAPGMRFAAPAYPVLSPFGDNLWIHHAIYAAPRGAALVVDCGSGGEAFGHWGEVMNIAAIERGLAALVISGGVRDVARLRAMNLPAFAGEVSIRGTGKDVAGNGALGALITLGDVLIRTGDIIVGDDDGVVCIPHERAGEIIARGEAREREEEQIFSRLRAGETTLDIYRLPTPRNLESKS